MMVAYKCKDIESGTLRHLKDLRQAGSLCDVTFTVGQDELRAHRCVLAVGSEYFKTLFMGQFMEASMQNIDLSEVTTDGKALEHVIEFLYTGDINIDDDNLEVLVKLSSYLMIGPLKDLCTKHLINTYKLKTCLQAYLLADKYNLDDIRKVFRQTLMSRLHDCGHIIFKNKLTLSPDEVLFLTDDVFHEHCTSADILYFVFKWLTDGMRDQRTCISVANRVFDTVNLKTIKPEVPCTEVGLFELKKSNCVDMFSKITEELEKDKGKDVEKFLRKSQKILMKTFPDTLTNLNEKERKTYNLRVGPSSTKKRKTEEFASSSSVKSKTLGIETVVVALVLKQFMVDRIKEQYGINQMDKVSEMSSISNSQPIFVLCCYVPSQRCWYHISDIGAEDILSPFKKKSRPLMDEEVRAVLFKEELVVKSNHNTRDMDVYFYDLRKKSHRKVSLPEPATFSEVHANYYSSYNFVTCKKHLYLLLKIFVISDYFENCIGEYFVGYRLSKDGQRWKLKFRTDIERFSDEGEYSVTECAISELQASISPISNEMIFTDGPKPGLMDGFNYVSIVNLNAKNPVPVNVHRVHAFDEDAYLERVSIIQTQSHFYIVDRANFKCCKEKEAYIYFEYKFNSLKLTESENEVELKLDDFGRSEFPCLEIVNQTYGQTLWVYQGCRHCLKSSMLEFRVKKNGVSTRRQHTPAPFTSVTAMAVGEMAGELLEQITQGPVQAFLHSDEMASDGCCLHKLCLY